MAKTDVFKKFGGFTTEAKAGRSHRVSEKAPFRTAPKTKK